MQLPSSLLALCACAAALFSSACASTSGGGGAAATRARPAAASQPATSRPAASPDAKRPATPAALLISEGGVGTISSIKYTSDDDMTEAIKAALRGLPGIKVSFAVMNIRGRETETEEGYFSVELGKTEVLQVLRPGFADMRGGTKLEVHALGSIFATAEGIRPGDRVASLIARRKGVTCRVHLNDRLGDLSCDDAKQPNIVYVVDATGHPGKPDGAVPPAALAKRKISEIVWGCASWCER